MLAACVSARQSAVGKRIEPLDGSDEVRLLGPSSLRPDGTVRTLRVNRPDGHMLMSTSAIQLRFHQVEAWARNEMVMAGSNLGIRLDRLDGWIQIEGPRMLPVTPQIDAEVYDVQLEIWERAPEPRQREREVE